MRTLVAQVRAHESHFRFITRERYGGIRTSRRAIAIELRLFASELATDLGRFAGHGRVELRRPAHGAPT